MKPSDHNPKRHLSLVKPGAPVQNIPGKEIQSHPGYPRVCPTCKCELRKPGEHGWVHGGYDMTNHRTIVKPCPTCSGGRLEPAPTYQQADLAERLFGGSQIPQRARNWTFETYPPDADQEAKRQVESFVTRHLAGDEKMHRGIYLVGLAGRGKTGLAICAIKEVLKTGELGLFVLTSDLINRFQASFNKSSQETEDELLKIVTTIPWLVLDDLGVERPTEYVMNRLYVIIEHRRNRGLYTVFTSNMGPSDLEKHWDTEHSFSGMRVIERIREYCLGVGVRGPNQRQRG